MKHLEPNRLILIGASTGGPRDIKHILKSISQEFRSSIIIAQHMGDEYMESFASHMSSNTHLTVKVAQDGEFLQCRTVYIASKVCHVVKNKESLSFKITTSKEESYNPNINELFTSCSHFSKNMDVPCQRRTLYVLVRVKRVLLYMECLCVHMKCQKK